MLQRLRQTIPFCAGYSKRDSSPCSRASKERWINGSVTQKNEGLIHSGLRVAREQLRKSRKDKRAFRNAYADFLMMAGKSMILPRSSSGVHRFFGWKFAGMWNSITFAITTSSPEPETAFRFKP
jgi:hypothetical protein